MHLPDYDEIGEAKCEDWFDANVDANGMVKCLNGHAPWHYSQGVMLSPDPYAIPICPICAEQEPKPCPK